MNQTKRSLKRQIEVQEQTIEMLERQVIAMGDMCKIKDLTLQTLVGAMSTKVDQEDIEKIITSREPAGPYL
jgi:hypothetical protein